MAHDHHHHVGAPRGADQRRALTGALALVLAFMVAEVVFGLLASSLALLSDAAHMLTDAAALALALLAARLAARPPAGPMTYGLGRTEIMSALANGVSLAVLAIVIAIEAVSRLFDPPHVDAAIVLPVALVGAVVNIAAARLLAGASDSSLNVEGSYRHVVTDLYASLGAAAAAVVVLATGFNRADAIASLLVATLMVHAGVALVRASGRIFLEAAPEGVDPEQVGRALAAQVGVREVHDLHVWEVTTGFPAISAHVMVAPGEDCHAIRRRLDRMLAERFDLRHATLQVDHEPSGALLEIEPADPAPRSR